VIVDTSDHTFLSTHLDISRVIEIYDHHFGYEAYWQDLLGHDAHIEPIGAAATLIWEQWKKRAPIEQISTNTAKLLAYAIVSNTSNFQL
jgi:nanoRNase/pAp phosphatase (c-di-AMP/oligoRNAs hydrolase)